MERATVDAEAVAPAALGAGHPLRAVRRAVAGLRTATGLLSVGTLASGILAYAFNIVAARALGVQGYGPVAVLWAAMFVASVVLFRPMEQTLSHGISERLARGQEARSLIRSLLRLTALVATAAVALIVVGWSAITDRLFSGSDVMTLMLALGIVGYAVSYAVRGILGGLQWFDDYGALLLADGAVRVVLLAPLLVVLSPTVAAVAVAGAAYGGTVVPLARYRARRRHADGPSLATLLAGAPAPEVQFGPTLAFAAPAAAIAASEQILVSGGALLVALTGDGGMAAAGVVFAATMLVRAPVFLFQGVAAFLLPTLTRLDASGQSGRLRRRMLVICAGILAGAVALAALSLLGGPQLMRLVFGASFVVSGTDLAILSCGVGAYLIAATLSQAGLARGEAAVTALSWVAASVTFIVVELSLTGAPFERVSVAFSMATMLAAAAMAVVIFGRPLALAGTAVLDPVGPSDGGVPLAEGRGNA